MGISHDDEILPLGLLTIWSRQLEHGGAGAPPRRIFAFEQGPRQGENASFDPQLKQISLGNSRASHA